MTKEKTSNRALHALAVLRAGGYFRYGLETNSYTRREQFQWRLFGQGGSVHKGYGAKTYYELVGLGHGFSATPQGFTGISTHYRLREPAEHGHQEAETETAMAA